MEENVSTEYDTLEDEAKGCTCSYDRTDRTDRTSQVASSEVVLSHVEPQFLSRAPDSEAQRSTSRARNGHRGGCSSHSAIVRLGLHFGMKGYNFGLSEAARPDHACCDKGVLFSLHCNLLYVDRSFLRALLVPHEVSCRPVWACAPGTDLFNA